MEMQTYPEVEEVIKRRVEIKAKTYGQEVIINMEEQKTESVYKIIQAWLLVYIVI